LHFKLKSRSYSNLPGQTRKEGRKASPRENPRERSRLPIGKEAPPTSGRRLRQRKENQPQSKRLERSGIGAPNTRHGPSTRNRNARELTSSGATIVPRKSHSQRNLRFMVLIASTSIAMLDSNLNVDCVCIFGGVHPVRITWQGSRQPVVHLLMVAKK
jgi:hypothetical protein